MILRRRSAPTPANLDNMNSLAQAAKVLDIRLGLIPSGTGSICYRSTGDRTFPRVQSSARDMLTHYGANPGAAEIHHDDYGFTWLVARRSQAQPASLVPDLRAACKVFADNDLGPQLLCAMTLLEGPGPAQTALVYLFKRGTIYPFAPLAGQARDNRLELAVKNVIEEYVPVESDLTRWFPVWGAPGMTNS
jgi:hypothetical protein